jgi:hypothetical protein
MWWYARVSKHGLRTYCECCYDTMLQIHRMMPIDGRAQGLKGRSCICLCQRAVTEHSPCDAGISQSHRYIRIARAADVLSHAMSFITQADPWGRASCRSSIASMCGWRILHGTVPGMSIIKLRNRRQVVKESIVHATTLLRKRWKRQHSNHAVDRHCNNAG